MLDCGDFYTQTTSELNASQKRAICDTLIKRAAVHFKVSSRQIRRASQGKMEVALARQIAMYVANTGCGLSFTDVAKGFGRDRTTISYACALVEDLRDDKAFDQKLEEFNTLAVAEVMEEMNQCQT